MTFKVLGPVGLRVSLREPIRIRKIGTKVFSNDSKNLSLVSRGGFFDRCGCLGQATLPITLLRIRQKQIRLL